jgi:hypothetical protein
LSFWLTFASLVWFRGVVQFEGLTKYPVCDGWAGLCVEKFATREGVGANGNGDPIDLIFLHVWFTPLVLNLLLQYSRVE